MRAPFSYFGGKSNLASEIVSRMPSHRVYVEPYFGSGAVLFAKPPVELEVINDRAAALVSFFRCLRDVPEELARVCSLTLYSRDEWQAAKLDGDLDGLDDLEIARRFWVRVTQSFAAWPGAKGSWSYGVTELALKPQRIQRTIGEFVDYAKRLRHVQIEHADAVEIIDRHRDHSETVFYVDPPYPISTRPTSADHYLEEMHDDESHERLSEALHKVAGTVILSGYASELYERLYGDWSIVRINVISTTARESTKEQRAREEVFWINRETFAQQTLFAGIEA